MIGGFTMKKFCVRFLSLLIILCMFSGCMLSINTQDETANAAASANDTARPMDPATANQPTAEPAPEPTTTPEPTEEPMTIENAEGIIALEANYTSATIPAVGSELHHTILVVDPITGDQHALQEITIPARPSEDVFYSPPSSCNISSTKDFFAPDYSKMAVSMKDYYAGRQDAGWFDVDGTFFNITAELGLQPQNDFEAPRKFAAVGFSSDGYFVFRDEEADEGGYYSGPLDNVSLDALEERNAITDELPELEWPYIFSDWVTSTSCLADFCVDGYSSAKAVSVLIDLTTGEEVNYVPGDARYSWNGVLSPDGSTIAFLSSPKEGREPPALYMIPLSGGEPAESPASFVFSSFSQQPNSPSFAVHPQLGTTCVTLLEWR